MYEIDSGGGAKYELVMSLGATTFEPITFNHLKKKKLCVSQSSKIDRNYLYSVTTQVHHNWVSYFWKFLFYFLLHTTQVMEKKITLT